MTDKELLVLAAKAVGQDVWTDCDGNLYVGEPERTWKPIDDDGDAFRLAVKLSLHIDQWIGEVQACNQYVDDDTHVWARESHNDNPCAATRRAIVRVAAMIGGAK